MKYAFGAFAWVFAVAPALAARPLDTVPVALETTVQEQSFDGLVEAQRESTVSSEAPGRIADIYFDVGDLVPAGAVILRLVGIEQREGLNQAEAALAETRAQFEGLNQEHQRLRELFARQLISRTEFERSQARFDAARAQVASAEAGLKAARERLAYTEVRAPYGGVVSARQVEQGEAVQPGTPLMSGFDPAALRVEVDLPQAVAERVRVSQQARVLVGAGINPVKLVLFPRADPATSTVRARLTLPESLSIRSPGLYPGQYVAVAFAVGEATRRLIPVSAVVQRAEVTGVYVVKNGRPALRQIRLGQRFGERFEVLSGLETGEPVATDPVAAGIALHAATRPEPVHD